MKGYNQNCLSIIEMNFTYAVLYFISFSIYNIMFNLVFAYKIKFFKEDLRQRELNIQTLKKYSINFRYS